MKKNVIIIGLILLLIIAFVLGGHKYFRMKKYKYKFYDSISDANNRIDDVEERIENLEETVQKLKKELSVK